MREGKQENRERRLRRLDVRTLWEVCLLPRSRAMAWFVRFNENIEGFLGEWLRERMVVVVDGRG